MSKKRKAPPPPDDEGEPATPPTLGGDPPPHSSTHLAPGEEAEPLGTDTPLPDALALGIVVQETISGTTVSEPAFSSVDEPADELAQIDAQIAAINAAQAEAQARQQEANELRARTENECRQIITREQGALRKMTEQLGVLHDKRRSALKRR